MFNGQTPSLYKKIMTIKKIVKTMIEYLNIDARWLKRSWDNCPVELRDEHLTQLKDSRGQTVWVN